VEALGPLRACVFQRERLWELYKSWPSLAFDLTWLAAREERILDENLVSVGRRSAMERIAYLIMHLYMRAETVGLAAGDRMTLPITQQHVADTLGLSLVHTNKTLAGLVRLGLVRWHAGSLELADRDKLAALAGFDLEVRAVRPLI
jgi:CRP-like cAMP-binding protein